MRKLLLHNFIISVFLTGVLFFVILRLLKPVIDDDVDIYFLYTLAGGYGSAPSAILHYAYGLHPILGNIIAGLFRYSQQVNWYSLFLLAFHFVCCVTLLMSLLKSFSRV